MNECELTSFSTIIIVIPVELCNDSYIVWFISPAAHTPDNSFLGFVVEQHLNASDIRHIDEVKRQNQSLVYGKVDNFWKVRRFSSCIPCGWHSQGFELNSGSVQIKH